MGRKGVIWRLCSPVFADRTYVYLDPVGAERAEKIAQVELRDVEPIEDLLLVPVPYDPGAGDTRLHADRCRKDGS